MIRSNSPVDIIIPIYNAFEDLVECVDSLFLNTAEHEFRLFLINDCSPDNRIEHYLESLNFSNIVKVSNDTNLGFVKTVNKGMSISNNDVILLNSDTIVTENWLSKLVQCAYSNERIATVTPFTNNGTICSVPNFGEDNEVPNGFTINRFAEMIEDISMRKYPQLPTAVGFCMYIKRSVLDEIGLFDDESYSKGYGEENDFCCRATEYGYINVLDDATFVYHKGSMSFKDDKETLIVRNSEVLRKKYPYYFDRVNSFLASNMVFPLVENIKKQLPAYSKIPKKRILLLTHNTVDEDWLFKRGGTEMHVKDIIDGLEEYEFYTLTTHGTRVLLKKFSNNVTMNYNFFIEYPIEAHTFYQADYAKILNIIIKGLSIDLIHVHHLQRHTYDIFGIANNLNIPLVYTAHDYHLICPSILLMDHNGEYCYDDISIEKCNSCLQSKMGYGTAFRQQWRNEVLKNLQFISLMIYPSESVKVYFEKEYQINKLNIPFKITEHGIVVTEEEDKNRDSVSNKSFTDRGFINVAFVGNFAKHKGSDIIREVLAKNNRDIAINWFLIGDIQDRLLDEYSNGTVYKIGGYNRNNLSMLLKQYQIDIVCLLSVVPETFSYTLSETWAGGIPVIVNDRGALGSRVEDNKSGWLVKNLSSDNLFNKLLEISKDYDMYSNVKDYVSNNLKVTTIVNMISSYRRIYKENINDEVREIAQVEKTTLNKELYESLVVLNQNNIHLERELQYKDLQLQAIYNTLGWRLLNYLRKNKGVMVIGKKVLTHLIQIKSRK
ncbi:glycosyltransferase [Paenibacillus amylolyticus]|uniref:Glycosyltransferase n=1 Tax=Paenibacillus amylolyticus TaxID=1451 RepID=A0A5M9WW75_PAEAM|nr:glycosyltransferase [Paenibacillus amylolyticus]KAA8785643.1 glycosyltransferase [Paenibacillus amylolyticus]MDP9702721.1 GT2 family glycosyltransferase/uncharacterized protein YeeX (DUF496 family) [Paenibacillus intestini]